MRIYSEHALLPSGWARNVAIEIGPDGMITNVVANSTPTGATRVPGPVVPGMPNLHSHAFQRAIAGRTGHATPDEAGGDSFWTWRAKVYAFIDRIDADAFEAIAHETYVEMLKAGYTSVAEFHYVHHDPQGWAYGNPAELSHRIVAAAQEAGIALTLLPVFYAHSGFGRAPPTHGQRRFVQSVDSYARLLSGLVTDASTRGFRLGIAAHSLRAVSPDELRMILALAPSGSPIHIHAAEQTQEVADCVAALGARPVEWLLDHAHLDPRWCVVHATHMTPQETRRLAAAGAVAGLAPTTEADLGDGTFAARMFLDRGGAFGVGSDSNTLIDPLSELRQLEWSQRLSRLERNVLAADGVSVGRSLYVRAAAGGAQALGLAAGAIAAGRRADLVVLNDDDPALADQAIDDVLDAAIFGPSRAAVRDVMVGGRWLVREGHHAQERAVLANYRATLARLAAAP